MKTLFTLALVCAAISWSAATVSAANAVNVTGTWNMTVQTGNGTGNPTFDLKQDGEKLSGTYKGQLGEAPVTGTLKGNAIALSFKVSGGGQDLQVEYAGTVEGDAMKGTVKLGRLGEGTFTGKKK